MTPERYSQIKTAFQLAAAVPAASRDSFLQSYCTGDEPLLHHLQNLLQSDEIPVTAIDSPPVGSQFATRLRALSQQQPPQPPR